jgi:hypothetical protein
VRARRAPAGGPTIVAALRELSPQAVVHLSGEARKPPYILGQWLPALEALRLRTFIVVREASQLQTLPPTTLPVVLARTGRDVSHMVVPSVRVAFYLANGAVNGDLLREPLVRHVFLNHGDSDKATSANPFNRVYDELWVAGQAAIDRYRAAGIAIPDEAFTIVGRPQLEALPVGARSAGSARTVLYAPTFEGYFEEANYSSLESMGPDIVRALLEHRPPVRVIFKAHPSTGHQRSGMVRARAEVERLLRDANAGGAAHDVVGDRSALSLYEAFHESDVLISDVSSVLTDFLWTERPIIATNPRGLDHPELVSRFPSHAAGYVLDSGGDVGPLLTAALCNDSKAEERGRVKRYVLGDPPGGALQAFVAAADRAYDAAVAHATRVENTFSF